MIRRLLFFAVMFFSLPLLAVEDPVSYVNPLMGSHSTRVLSSGNTYPAIAVPWGMNFWTPQTGKMGDGWTYCYDADKICGFKQTHQPSPWMNDYGMFSLMPMTGDEQPVVEETKRASWFSHKAETARPFYYKVYLADYDITTELAPTSRAAVFRFTFPESKYSYVAVDAFHEGSYVKVIPQEQKIIGYTTANHGGVAANFRNYFVVKFDKPFTYTFTADDGVISSALEKVSKHAVGIIGFSTCRGDQVYARVASSFISYEQAEQNLLELGDESLDAVASKARHQWNDILGRIEVSDSDNVDHLRTFYTCLYRSVLFPRSFYELDKNGEPIHYSPYNGQVLPGYLFADTGFWDTFRALFPLVNLVYPSMSQKMQQGWVNAYKESGFLPEWSSPGHRNCMIGNNSASVVADAWLNGIRGYDIETLWKAVTHDANAYLENTASGRLDWEDYNKLGYVPYDKVKESAARTLEYAYDDWCIYQLGKALGKKNKELKPYAMRAMNYRNLFDKEHLLMRGRLSDGTFAPDFNPFKWGDAFTEGNSWHYTWSVFHDPQGLINLMGSRDVFAQMLDRVFQLPPIFDDSYYGTTIHEIREMQIMNMGNYAHGNQPIQHMLYLYDYCGQPWKGQYWIRQVMDKLYNARADGYCGDEDNGQTSAWYVFSAMGFYPVCPGSGQYVIGTPYFRNLTLHLENGRDVSIKTTSAVAEKPYVDALQMNGTTYDKNYLLHTDLLKGLKLEFKMSEMPNTERASSPDSAPYSFSR